LLVKVEKLGGNQNEIKLELFNTNRWWSEKRKYSIGN